jgi:predicted HNH restriction endonuclease
MPTSTETHTYNLVQWFSDLADANDGLIPTFQRQELPAVLGMNEHGKPHRVIGNVQSRIDFACYSCQLPPLGLIAAEPYKKAWSRGDRSWSFPVQSMRTASRERQWSAADFVDLKASLGKQSGVGFIDWKKSLEEEEEAVKAWAYSFGSEMDGLSPQDKQTTETKRSQLKWSRDELILALALYLPNRNALPGKASPAVHELSEFLNRMGRVLGLVDSATYRNVNGVYMKMMNFRSLDPTFTDVGKVGLQRRNKDEHPVWQKFSGEPALLQQIASSIRSAVAAEDSSLLGVEFDEPDFIEAEEGKVLTRLHKSRERSRKLVDACKKAALKKHKRLTCEACSFDFGLQYGVLSEGLIEVHHKKPVHTLKPGDKTKLSDLALLCANCHRVVHSSKRWLSIEELKQRIQLARVNTPFIELGLAKLAQ